MAARNSRVFKTDRLRVFLEHYMAQRADVNYKASLVDVETLPKVQLLCLVETRHLWLFVLVENV